MQQYRNLILDSTLARETYELLRFSGKRADSSEIARIVFKTPDLDPEVAALLVGDVLRDDPRFVLNEDATVELILPDLAAQKLSETDFIVFDTETTGAKPRTARIMEIGAYRVRNNKIIEEFETLINPNALIPANIIALTGITDDMVQKAPQFSEILPDLLEFIGESILVAHNAPFDIGFLNEEINRVHPERKLANLHFCTVRLSRKLLPNLKNHRLHTIAEHYSIPIYNRHRAGGDALATAKIFVRFLEHLSGKGVADVAGLKNLKT